MEERIRVLAVDADVAVLRQRARILEDRHGFDVDTAQSIQTAKERLNDSAQSIDCILYHAVTDRIDDALEFISWVADRFPSIPTVFSTDVSIDSMPDEAFECGATAFVPAGKTTAPHNRLASRIRSLVTAQLESASPEDSGFVWLGGDQPDTPTANDDKADAIQDEPTDDNQQIPPETIASIRKALKADGYSTRSNRLVAFLLLEVLHRVRGNSSDETHSASETHSLDELEAGYERVVERITTQSHQTDNADTAPAPIEPNRVLQIIDEEFPSVTGDAFSSLLGQLLDIQRGDGSRAREFASPIDDTPVDEEDEMDPLLALVQTSLGEMSADVLPDELSNEPEVAEEIGPEDTAPSIESPPTPEVAQSDGGLLGLVEAAFSDPRAIDGDDKPPTALLNDADDSVVSESQFDTPTSGDVPTEAGGSTSEEEETSNSVASLVSAALSETDGNTGVADSSAEHNTDREAIGESPIEARDTEALSEYPIGELDTEEIDVSALDEHDAKAARESAQEAHKSDAADESTHHEHDTEAIEESVIEETRAEEIEESDIAELEELTETEPNAILNDITAEVSDDRLKNLSRDELLALVKDLTDSETQTGADQTASERTPEDDTTVTTTAEETTGDTAVADDSPESTSDVSTAKDLSQPTDDSRQQPEDLGQPTDETRQQPEDLSQSTDKSRQSRDDLSQSTDDRAQATGTTQTRNTADESAAMSQPDKSASPDVDTQSTDPFDQFGSGQTEYDRPGDLELTPGDVVLVQCGSQDDRKQQACIDLLGVDDVADRNVLLVRYTEMNGPRLERIATHANRVTLVSVGYNQRVPQSVQQAVRTVNVTNPNDVTRLGIVITATLDNWSARDGETVVCFDPLNVLLRYKNVENVFRFLHILLGKLRSGNAISHFHVDPTAGDPQEINTLKPLFDSVLTIDSVGVSVEH